MGTYDGIDTETGAQVRSMLTLPVVPAGELDRSQWGLRQDGTPKGLGWLGPLRRPDGGVSSEITMGVTINGREVDVPTLVPTLNRDEVDYLLSMPQDRGWERTPLVDSIQRKAVEHATGRLNMGLSPFKD
jgi:hypothetical protein